MNPALSLLFAEMPPGDRAMADGWLRLFSSDEPTRLKKQSQIIELYDELRPSVYGYLISFGLQPQEADDIVQEAFLRLFGAMQSGGEIRNPRSWVFRVAHNLSLNLLKRERRLFSRNDEQTVTPSSKTADPENPEDLYLHKEQMRLLDVAMGHLTLRQRQCVHLRAEGLRYREIAEVLGSTPSGVAQSLKRAVERLMKGLYE